LGGSWFEASSGKYFTIPPISKITTTKWTGNVAQAIEHLLCKCEVLSSNPNPTPPPKKASKNKLGVVVCNYNPSYEGGKGRSMARQK
jgi:hypothetical protein